MKELKQEDIREAIDNGELQEMTNGQWKGPGISQDSELQIVFPGETVQKEMPILQIITNAVKDKTQLEVIEKLIDLKNKEEDRSARKSFFKALSKFQAELPEIEKTTIVYNKDSITERYRYAKIGQIVKQIKEPMTNNGLSFTLSHEFVEKGINIICTVNHCDGYSHISTPVFMPMESPDFMKMTEQQKVGTAHTYGDRYALSGALGVVTIDQDVDGNKEKHEENLNVMRLYRLAIVGILSSDVFPIEDKEAFKTVAENFKTVTDYKTYYEMTLKKKKERSADFKKIIDDAVKESSLHDKKPINPPPIKEDPPQKEELFKPVNKIKTDESSEIPEINEELDIF